MSMFAADYLTVAVIYYWPLTVASVRKIIRLVYMQNYDKSPSEQKTVLGKCWIVVH